jgi:hypothetical protein
MVNHNSMDLHRWIVDYYTLRPADFIVMDALQGIQYGPTPSFSQSGVRSMADAQMNMRSVLASTDSLAIDIVQANVMNWDFESVHYLVYMIDAGVVGNGNPQNIVVLGERVDTIRTDFRGTVPILGGRRITNPTPPTVSINSVTLAENRLEFDLTLSENTNKIDIYINGEYITSIHESMSHFSLPWPHGNTQNVTVYAFDLHMHHAAATAEI